MAEASNAAAKQAIRQTMRERRRALSAARQRQHGRRLALHVARQHWFRDAHRLALYMAADGEIDTLPLIRLCWRLGKQVFLPRLEGDEGMVFARHRSGSVLARGPFGLLQPGVSAPAAKASSLDAIFTPLVAFTPRGERLGMGGGYYDRVLAEAVRGGPVLVGLAHSCQQLEKLPTDSWDIRLAAVITETGAVRPPSGMRSFSLKRLRQR